MTRLYRKVIRIRAVDSPNVRYALAQIAKGQQPTGEQIVDGVMPWAEYQKRLHTWDKIRRTIGLDAQFYSGAEILLFPTEWLDFSERLALTRIAPRNDITRYMGVDPAEGGDKSSWCIVDQYGVLKLSSILTPNTTLVTSYTQQLMIQYDIDPINVLFDRGGGGKQHVDRLREEGFPVRAVGFGEAVSLEPKRGQHRLTDRKDIKAEKSVFTNRRAQMYGEASELLDPSLGGFAIPPNLYGMEGDKTTELRNQLAPIPKRYREGKLILPPKNKRDRDSHEETLTDLIGHSPDEADAFVLAVHAMLHVPFRPMAGVE